MVFVVMKMLKSMNEEVMKNLKIQWKKQSLCSRLRIL